MKKISKRIFSALLCGICVFSTVYAQEVQPPVTYTLTLDQAIDMAIKDNPQLKVLDIEKKSNEINLRAAQLTKTTYRNFSEIQVANYDLIYIKNGYYVDMYKRIINLHPKKTDQATAQIKYKVTESYYNYKIADELCRITADALALAQENLDSVTKRFELGMIAQIDLDNARLSVESVKNTYDTYLRNAAVAKENFKINLDIDGECEFNLTDNISYEEFSADAKEDSKKAMDSRYDVSALKMNYEMSKKYFDYTKGLGETTAKYQTAYSDYISKEYAYTNNSKLIALSIQSSYNNVLNADAALKIAEKSVDIAKQKYDINKIKFENGMIINSDLTKSMNDYLSENIKLENARLTYKMAVEKYKAEITVGL